MRTDLTDKEGKPVAVALVPEESAYAIAYQNSSEAVGVSYFLDLGEDGKDRIFYHTEVPRELGGRGLGTALVQEAVADTVKRGKTVVTACRMVKGWIDKHQEEFKAMGGTSRAPSMDDFMALDKELGDKPL